MWTGDTVKERPEGGGVTHISDKKMVICLSLKTRRLTNLHIK